MHEKYLIQEVTDMDFFENLGSKLNKVGSDASHKYRSACRRADFISAGKLYN